MAKKIKKTRIVLIGAGGSFVAELLAALREESTLERYAIDSATIDFILIMDPDEREKCIVIYVRVPYFLRITRLLRAGIQSCEEIALRDTTLYANAEQVADMTVRNFVVTNSVSDILDYIKKR